MTNHQRLKEAFLAVARTLGCVATHEDPRGPASVSEFLDRFGGELGGLRATTSTIAYLQAPTGWRQRITLQVVLGVNHPLSEKVPLTPGEIDQGMTLPPQFLPTRLPTGKELKDLTTHLEVLVRSGMPLVLEKCVTDRLPLDSFSPRVVGPQGVQIVQRQTLRVWNTLAVWMREYTQSPRGMPSLLREQEHRPNHHGLPASAPPFLL